jgi:DNA-binding YbaB/EbfC family protein
MPGVDLNHFIKQANKLTAQIEKRKTTLADETVEGKAGDGLVVATANGVQELKGIKIDPKAIDPTDTAMLEDLVTAAVNAALTASREHMQKELGKISQGIPIPGVTR